MAITATYDAVLSRIRLSGNALGATATYAVFDRTTDGARYTTVRGGEHDVVTSQLADLDDFEFPAGIAITYRVRSYSATDVLQATFTVVITQDLTSVWFKSLSQAYLNQATKITKVGPASRASRSGVFPVIARSMPVVISDVRGSRQIRLQVNAVTRTQGDDFDWFLASGDPVFIHAPSTNTKVKTGYFNIDDYEENLVGAPSDQKFFDLSLTEYAGPTAEIVPVTMTWNGVKARYATWNAVIAANASWNAVMALTGKPSDVYLP